MSAKIFSNLYFFEQLHCSHLFTLFSQRNPLPWHSFERVVGLNTVSSLLPRDRSKEQMLTEILTCFDELSDLLVGVPFWPLTAVKWRF